MFVDRAGGDRYDVVYYDEAASGCGGDPLSPALIRTSGVLTPDRAFDLEPTEATCVTVDTDLGDIALSFRLSPQTDRLVSDFDGSAFTPADFWVFVDPADYLRTCDDPDLRPDAACVFAIDFEYHGYAGDPAIAADGATRAHAYGGGTGFLGYTFYLPFEPRGNAHLFVPLSSEFPWYEGPPDGFSDVNLVVNAENIIAQRVISDDGLGEWYEWEFPSTLLQEGTNSMGFAVRPGEFANGVAIYGHSLVPGVEDGGIIIEIPR